MSRPFSPLVPCTTPGCPNGTLSGGRCADCYAEYKRAHAQSQGASQRGYEEGWAEEFMRHHPLCEHRVPGRCKGVAALPDHYPKSRKELKADGVSDEHLNDWQYLVASCEPCHRWLTSQRQPGGWNQPGWRRSA